MVHAKIVYLIRGDLKMDTVVFMMNVQTKRDYQKKMEHVSSVLLSHNQARMVENA